MRGLGGGLGAAQTKKKPAQTEDFDDFMDDNIGLKPQVRNNKPQKKNQTTVPGAGGGHDTLAFLRKADEETKQKEQFR